LDVDVLVPRARGISTPGYSLTSCLAKL
jgi:hypothetical protein